MDWSNERYVRVYTRDTGDWLALSYHAQCLMLQLLRKVDRSGVLDLGRQGLKGVAVVLQQVALWESTIAPALQELLADGCVQLTGTQLVIPNFTPAQEAAQSDRFRAAESRARRREAALKKVGDTLGDTETSLGDPNGRIVTNRDSAITPRDPGVTNGDASVTAGHTTSQPVTSRHSSLTDPSQSRSGVPAFDCVSGSGSSYLDQSSSSGWVPDGPVAGGLAIKRARAPQLQLVEPRAADPARVEAREWLDWFNREFHRAFTLRDELVKQVRALLAKRFTQKDLRMVALFKQHLWQGKPEMQGNLVPATLLRLNTFGSYLDQAREWFGPEESHGS